MTNNIKHFVLSGIDKLKHSSIENPKIAVEIILMHILKLRRIDLYLEPERKLTTSEEVKFWGMIERKKNHEPLQYIVAGTEWYGLDFICDQRALIPRPETEILLERAVELMQKIESPEIIDIGTGTGAIAIALAVSLPESMVTATDISNDSLTLASENIKKHNLEKRVKLQNSNLFGAIDSNDKFDLIISNPPYIRNSEYETLMLEVHDHEPKEALLAGDDGLEIIRLLINTAYQFLKPKGYLLFEYGIDHTEPINKLYQDSKKYLSIDIIVDYNGIDRGALFQVK